MAVFDVEDFMDRIKDLMVDTTKGINIEIDNLNNEKNAPDVARFGHHIALDNIDLTNAVTYFWPKRLVNRTPYMVIYPREHTTSAQDVEFVEIGIAIIFIDKADGLEPERRLLRYAKAIKRVLLRKRFSGYFSSGKVRTIGYEAISDDKTAGKMFKYTAEVALSGELTNE